MNNLGFQIGKELGELKARLDSIEGKPCGCKGKGTQVRGARRNSLCGKLEGLHLPVVDAVNKAVAEVLTNAGIEKQLFLTSYVLSESQASPTEICCYYCENGDYCCGDCDDPFCRNC